MAMSKDGLSAALKTKISGISGITITNDAELQKFTDAVADAIVSYITTNASVLVTAVQAGPGTATGTVS